MLLHLFDRHLLFGYSLVLGCLAYPTWAAIDDPERLISAVVSVQAEVPSEARTAAALGTERRGSGVVIDDNGLIVTIGYLILEADRVEVVDRKGTRSPADIIAYDHASGFGLVRALQPLDAEPIPVGKSSALTPDDPVIVASREDAESATLAVVVSRRAFAGYWEYLLESAVFTSPPHHGWGGAALIDKDGMLVGIGSLMVGDAREGSPPVPGNMFGPIDELKPILADLLTQGRSASPPRPWLGIYPEEAHGRLFVSRVAEDGPAQKAGISRGDIILAVDGKPIADMADFYRKVWALGDAGVRLTLTLLQGAKSNQVVVQSDDRYKWLRLDVSF